MSRSIVAANIVERDTDKYRLCEHSMRTILRTHGGGSRRRGDLRDGVECVYVDRKKAFSATHGNNDDPRKK